MVLHAVCAFINPHGSEVRAHRCVYTEWKQQQRFNGVLYRGTSCVASFSLARRSGERAPKPRCGGCCDAEDGARCAGYDQTPTAVKHGLIASQLCVVGCSRSEKFKRRCFLVYILTANREKTHTFDRLSGGPS